MVLVTNFCSKQKGIWVNNMATGQLFSKTTQALFYNYKQLPIQRMLDFDFLCGLYTISYSPNTVALDHNLLLTLCFLFSQEGKHLLLPASSTLVQKGSKNSFLVKRKLQSQCTLRGFPFLSFYVTFIFCIFVAKFACHISSYIPCEKFLYCFYLILWIWWTVELM